MQKLHPDLLQFCKQAGSTSPADVMKVRLRRKRVVELCQMQRSAKGLSKGTPGQPGHWTFGAQLWFIRPWTLNASEAFGNLRSSEYCYCRDVSIYELNVFKKNTVWDPNHTTKSWRCGSTSDRHLNRLRPLAGALVNLAKEKKSLRFSKASEMSLGCKGKKQSFTLSLARCFLIFQLQFPHCKFAHAIAPHGM
jgi:hypothetical protein